MLFISSYTNSFAIEGKGQTLYFRKEIKLSEKFKSRICMINFKKKKPLRDMK